MTLPVKLKRSGVPGRIPGISDLDYGEIAINYADGKLYYKTSGGTIDSISGSGSGSTVITQITYTGYNTRRRQEFTATAGQTTFTPTGGYIVGGLDVIHNGSTLANSDYTATDGTTVVLAQAAQVGDTVVIIADNNPQDLITPYADIATAMAIALG